MRGTLVATCLVLACAHQPRPPPLSGWHELRSEHFRLRTDIAPGAARLTLERLETLRAAVRSAWAAPGDTPDTADAVVLGDITELSAFTEWPGLSTVLGARPLLVTAAARPSAFEDELPSTAVLAHELVHVLARWRMPSAAPWFEEGLAELVGTLRLRGNQVTFGGGGFPSGLPDESSALSGGLLGPLEAWGTERVLPLDEVDRGVWDFPTPRAARLAYRSARLWVQGLRDREPERMRALEVALAQAASWRTAWARVRPGLDAPALEEVLVRWVQTGTAPIEIHAFSPPSIHGTARVLPSWEVHLVLADLWLLAGSPDQQTERVRRARAELAAASHDAPGEALPQVRLAELEADPEVRLARAEKISRAHPDSPEAAVFLAGALRDDGRDRPGRGAAIARAVALAPDDLDALTAQAVEQARGGDVGTGIDTARRAVARAPWSPTVFRVEANLLAAAARCDEALEAARRALAVLPHRAPPELVTAIHRDQALIGSSCGGARAPAR